MDFLVSKPIKYGAVVASVAILGYLMGLDVKQMTSLIVLAGMIGATLMFWRFRLVFAFFALALMLGTDLLEIDLLIKFAHLDTILFLASMMVVVGYLEEARFFEYVIDRLQA
ncbi:MAG: hypothetical protein QXN47_06535, partial [Candidatus Caldarchaeum sp.]